MQRLINHSDQSLVSLALEELRAELSQEASDGDDVLLFDKSVANLDKLADFNNNLLLLGLLQPLGYLQVVQPDCFDLDAHLLVSCHVLSAVFLQAQLIKRGLIAAIEFLEEEFFEIWVLLLLLADHLSG